MATRDVILKALQGWCWIGGAPLHLRALDSYDLERIADVAAGAVEGHWGEEVQPLDGGIVEKKMFSLRCTGCEKPYINREFDFDSPTWASTWERVVELAEDDGWICRPVARRDPLRRLPGDSRRHPGRGRGVCWAVWARGGGVGGEVLRRRGQPHRLQRMPVLPR